MENQLSSIGKKSLYNQSKLGIYGNLGKGENADILFLETVITAADLDMITLIKDIPGAEKWDIKDLFQRDVDDDRVEKEVIPYFKDESKIKYFSPITLILLPTDIAKKNIIKDIDYIEPITYTDANAEVKKSYEKEDFYKLSLYNHKDPLATIEWNDKRCYLVAIDGQHRLSGLIRWRKEPNSNFEDWKIPVVILNILKVDKNKNIASLLEIVRKTFVYINNKTERINPAKIIILNNESVNSICTQELINFSHQNDLKKVGDRDNNLVPLIFYDWQGKVSNKVQIIGPASLKSVEEIRDWFMEYLLGDDGSAYQEYELCLKDLSPKLEGYGVGLSLSNEDSKRIRKQFNDICLPGLSYLLQNFYPYKEYIKKCREFEKASIERSDIASHAFMYLRFGSHNAPEAQTKSVNEEYTNLIASFEAFKKSLIDVTIRRDIGMRGIVFAFSEIKSIVSKLRDTNIDWLLFSEQFTKVLSKIYQEKWFVDYGDLKPFPKETLTFLIFDEVGSTINYKIQNAKDGLGSLLVVLVIYDFYKNNTFEINNEEFDDVWGEYSNNLRKSYEKGFRKKIKGDIQDDWKQGNKKLNEHVKLQAEIESTKKIEKVYKLFNK